MDEFNIFEPGARTRQKSGQTAVKSFEVPKSSKIGGLGMDEFDIQLRDALARQQAGRQAAQSFEMPQASIVGGRYIRPSFGDALVQG